MSVLLIFIYSKFKERFSLTYLFRHHSLIWVCRNMLSGSELTLSVAEFCGDYKKNTIGRLNMKIINFTSFIFSARDHYWHKTAQGLELSTEISSWHPPVCLIYGFAVYYWVTCLPLAVFLVVIYSSPIYVKRENTSSLFDFGNHLKADIA